MAVRAKTPRMSKLTTALSPEHLRARIAAGEAEAAQHRAKAAALDNSVSELRQSLEAMERGEIPLHELREKVMRAAQVEGWVTRPRVSKWWPQVPMHQIEQVLGALERDGILYRNDEVDPTGDPGRPPLKYHLRDESSDGPEPEPEPEVKAANTGRRRTGSRAAQT